METVGSLIDKLSINELKIYHMKEQSIRDDVNEEFRRDCQSRLGILMIQRDDLGAELQELIDDVVAGRKRLLPCRKKRFHQPQREASQQRRYRLREPDTAFRRFRSLHTL